jgi:hypothetical protein
MRAFQEEEGEGEEEGEEGEKGGASFPSPVYWRDVVDKES